MPLIVIELKSAVTENVTIENAYLQIKTYQDELYAAQIETLIKGLLQKKRLIDIIKNFTLFAGGKSKITSTLACTRPLSVF